MTTPDRSRFLGDVGDSDPQYWAWGGPAGRRRTAWSCSMPAARDLLDERQAELLRRLAGAGIGGVTVLDTLEHARTRSRSASGTASPSRSSRACRRPAGASRTVPAGEFVLGYPNGYGQLTDRPLLPASDDPGRLLLPDPAGTGRPTWGATAPTWCCASLSRTLTASGATWVEVTRRPDGSERSRRGGWRWPRRWSAGGRAALRWSRRRTGTTRRSASDNDFGYTTDPLGLACPLGAHIRRANPRDSLDPQPAASLDASDLHRLLRRGRSYGPAAGRGSAGHEAGGAGHAGRTGLYFICLAASLARQFEFVQHTWLNNPTFNGLYDDADPLTGGRHPGGATFTVPARPVRRRYRGLPQFVRTRGGAYFFLPGISALRYLARLPEAALRRPAAR